MPMTEYRWHDPRCPVQRDGLRCCFLPGHSEDPKGKHHDEILGDFAEPGSPADDWLNLLGERSVRSTTDTGVTVRRGPTVRP